MTLLSEDDLIYLEYFLRNAKRGDLKIAADYLGLTQVQIYGIIYYQNKKHSFGKSKRFYTKKDDEFIKRYYGILSTKKIAERLRRSVNSVNLRAEKIGCRMHKKVKPFKNEIIELASEGFTRKQISEKLDLNLKSLSGFCERNNIKTMRDKNGWQKMSVKGKTNPWEKNLEEEK